MESHLQLIPGHLLLCLLVDPPPLRFNSRITPVRLGFLGNTIPLRRTADADRHIPLLAAATLLPELRIHHQGSPRSRITLTSLTLHPRVTLRPGISHHLRSLLIPRRPDRPHRLTIHLRARLDTARLNRPHKHPTRSRPTLVGRASRQYRHNLPKLSHHRSRLLPRILPRSRRILRLNQDTHSHILITPRRRNRGTLVNRRRNSHRISRRSLPITKVLTRPMGILLRLRDQGKTHSLGGEGKVRLGSSQTLL